MWLMALIPVYLLVALVIARFCHLNSRLDQAALEYWTVLEAEERAEDVLTRARSEAEPRQRAPEPATDDAVEQLTGVR